jgi:ssDNA-binding Zn-finger/Zn-ribbon topoisomerase 1
MKLQDNAEVERTCPKCGPTVKLIVKTNRLNDNQFLGCPRWPMCDHTEPIPEALRMQALGAQRLPGF